MTAARLVAAVLAVAASLVAIPVQAASGPSISLAIAQRWQVAGAPGSWTSYEVAVQNQGSSDFTGDVYAIPVEQPNAPVGLWPLYRARVTVARGTAQNVAFYVLQAPSGYRAEVRDTGGKLLGGATTQVGAGRAYAIGILSDVHAADTRITSLRPLPSPASPIAVTQFATAAAFPSNAVYLSGLNAILVDDFDSGSLSQAQVQALRDFVGLGGSLVLGGGASWRRTLLPLPVELLPLRPSGSATASLAPVAALADLGGDAVSLEAPIVTGDLKGRMVVGSPDSPPLVAEGAYGSGRVIELAYDPFAAPLDANARVAAVSWAQALSRAVRDQAPAGGRGFGPGGLSGLTGGAVASVNGALSPGPRNGPVVGLAESQLSNLLRDTPVASTPPLGLMAGLLVAYVVLVGPLVYIIFSALRRRELMWGAIPLIAILFTALAYGAGIGSRGSGYFDNQIEIQRLGADGTVETQAYHGIFAPHRGDYSISVPANTLVSTVLGVNDSFPGNGQSALVTAGVRQRIDLTGVPVWSMQTVQTLSVGHQRVAIEAHLALDKGHIRGTVVNHTPYVLRRLVAVSGVGQRATLAQSVPPGASAAVDSELVAAGATGLQKIPQPPVGSSGGGSAGGGAQPPSPPGAAPAASSREDSLINLAASEGVSSYGGDFSLVSLTSPETRLEVSGSAPTRSTLAAILAPLAMESEDSLPPGGALPRLVSANSEVPRVVNVYDFELPAGLAGSFRFTYSFPSSLGNGANDRQPVQSLELYDWVTGGWDPLPRSSPTGVGSVTVQPGEMRGGVVRARVRENTEFSANIHVVTTP